MLWLTCTNLYNLYCTFLSCYNLSHLLLLPHMPSISCILCKSFSVSGSNVWFFFLSVSLVCLNMFLSLPVPSASFFLLQCFSYYFSLLLRLSLFYDFSFCLSVFLSLFPLSLNRKLLESFLQVHCRCRWDNDFHSCSLSQKNTTKEHFWRLRLKREKRSNSWKFSNHSPALKRTL